jgi:hypothetical protein
MSFLRHREIFPSDEGAGLAANAPAHRLDEFPAGYSLGRLRSRRAGRRFTSRSPFCRQFFSPYNEFSSNGDSWVNWLSQPRGPLQNVGNALEERLRTGDDKFAVTAESLQDLAKKTWAGMERKYVVNPINRVMLVVVYGDEPQLWRLNVLGPESHAIKVETIAVAGALGNTARFFVEYYQSERTADQLTFLAAHTVLAGSRIDRLYVDGLNVATFTRSCNFLNRQQIAKLKRKSTALDEMIRHELLD